MYLKLKLIIVLLIILQAPYLFASDNKEMATIVVFPFSVSEEGKYAYLNKAINQMLLARLSRYEDLNVRPADLSDEERQAMRSALQGGDLTEAAKRYEDGWIVDPAMYSLTDGMQLNLTLYPLAGGRPVPLSEKVERQEEIIDALGSLSASIHDIAKGQETEPAPATKPQEGEDTLSGFATPHPERAYKKGLFSGSPIVAGDQGGAFESRGVRKSGSIPLLVESMALGDLDGDGKDDLVISSKSKIQIFTYHDLKFQTVAEYDFSPRMKIHAINVGDPGNSGTQKLYVSGNDGRFASSAILSWNGGKTLQLLTQGLPWYIRPLAIPGKAQVLLGQQANDWQSDDFLRPGVFELTIDSVSGKLEKGARLPLPEDTNLFDFVQADLDGDGQIETVVIDKKQKLLVYDAALNLIWVSNANYGGSKKYFGPQRGKTDLQDFAGLTEAQQDNRQLIFIPGRLDTKDITGDGLPEVVVSTNDIGISKYLENTRTYEGGSVACLGWFGQGLAELWQTNQIPGYVADYFFDNTDSEAAGGGRVINRLYVAQIPIVPLWKQLLPSPESKLLAYEMTVRKATDNTAAQ